MGVEGPLAVCGAEAGGVHRTPCSTCPRTRMETQPLRNIEPEDGPQSTRGFSWGPCAIIPRKWGEGAGAPGDVPLLPLPAAMVTQPRCPWPDKRGSPARDRHLSLPRLSRDPSPSSTGAPPPSPVTWGWSLYSPVWRNCPLRTRRGRGFGRTAPPYPTHPFPHSRKCLSEGTSLTSQGFDVKGCVPIREHWDQERRETRGRHPRLGSVPAPWL